MLVTTGHPPACDSGCITVSPSTAKESMTTTVTISAQTGSGSTPGWYDYDSDGIFTYSFGYLLGVEKYMLNAVPQTSTSVQTSSLPPGELTFFVTVHDAHGVVGPVALGQTGLLAGTIQTTTISPASDISSAALTTVLEYDAANTAPEEALRIVSSVSANMDTSTLSATESDNLITKLATNLDTVLGGSGGAMTDMAAGALELITEQPSALSQDTTDLLASCLDTTLSKSASSISSNTALQLIEVTANLGQAHSTLNSRRADTAQWSKDQLSRLVSVSHLAAGALTPDDPGIMLQASHISGTLVMQLQKVHSTGLGGASFGSDASGAVVQMSSSFTAMRRVAAVYTFFVNVMDTGNSLNTNTQTKYTLSSNIIFTGLINDASPGEAASFSGTAQVNLYNTADNSAPMCLFWDGAEYKSAAEGGPCTTDLTQSYRTVGGAVVCQCTELGSVAVGMGCDAATDCSAHGSCNADATCKCEESWWGADCSVQRCTDVTTCGPNNFQGECVFNQSATTAQQPAYPKSGCAEIQTDFCNPVNSSEFWQSEDVSEDPQLYGDCMCFCGWSGALCDTKMLNASCTSGASRVHSMTLLALLFAAFVGILGIQG